VIGTASAANESRRAPLGGRAATGRAGARPGWRRAERGRADAGVWGRWKIPSEW